MLFMIVVVSKLHDLDTTNIYERSITYINVYRYYFGIFAFLIGKYIYILPMELLEYCVACIDFCQVRLISSN